MKDPPAPAPAAQPVPAAYPSPQPVATAPQLNYVTYQVNGPTAPRQDSSVGATVRTMGIVALSFMLVGLIPCLGWLNYINLVLSFITIVMGIVAIASAKSDTERGAAFLGVALAVIAIFFGFGRLILGGGCL